jgi:tetraacyldisaccharide 4'-kinase
MKNQLLKPVYWMYTNYSHRRVIRNSRDPVSVPARVISIGNITFGGTSKTPLTVKSGKKMADDGKRVGIVYRGWRGRVDIEKRAPSLVSDGKKILMDWHESGDEALMVARELIGWQIPVIVGRDRIRGAQILIENYGVDTILLDDGFQFRRLERDLDFVLVDALAPWGDYDGEFGLLREFPKSLRRADIVGISHSEAVDENRLVGIREKILETGILNDQICELRTIPTGITDLASGEKFSVDDLAGKKVGIIAGIGNPRSFQHTVRSSGAVPVHERFYMDHYPYRRRDIQKFSQDSLDQGADVILTTSKDAIRLENFPDRIGLAVWILEINVEMSSPVMI